MKRIIISNNITSPSGTSGAGIQLEIDGKIKKSVIVIPNELIPLKQKIALAKLSIKEIFQSNQKVKTASQISLLTWEYYKKYLEK